MKYNYSISAEEIEKLEVAGFAGDIILIDNLGDGYEDAISVLSKEPLIGFDTETKPCFQAGMPRNKVALLQLSTGNKAYLFRINEIGLPESLANILANPKIMKIGAAVHDDIRGLKVHRGFEAGGFVDLQTMVSNYGIGDKSVRKVAAIVLGVRVSKTQQLSNWEADYLSDAQLRYAAIDAWVCREIYIKLTTEV